MDDDDVDREKLRRILKRTELQVEIVEAASVAEALERFADTTLDCVLVDYRLGEGRERIWYD